MILLDQISLIHHHTWFLPQDFTFTATGPLRLGQVLPHWTKPTTVLAAIGSDAAKDIALPATQTLVERNHGHHQSRSRFDSLSLWARFEGLASASTNTEVGAKNSIDYGQTDHEIRSFAEPLLPDKVTAIANIPTVRKHIHSGMFGKRSVYVVSGLRIATSSFTVTKSESSNFTVGAEASGPPSGTTPVEVGATAKHDSRETVTDSYDTAPGIVFAYQMYVIRTRRAGSETELFTHESGFLTGEADEKEEPLVLVDATKEEIDEDLDEEVDYESVQIGDDEWCIYLPPKK
ncbi:hypothetical protein GJ744_002993 [Endocarpon pusillum]|uniref:Uncharacterized protein n=1 Tax=Endocarpon pusillum TaxID=364733 RepID=A0A8H7AA29_9EURO|nr:hypothetical protein GJ744_002993 [Endocarpon pusillum]